MKVLTRRFQQAAFVVLLAASVAGCGSRPVRYYVLDATPAPTVASAPQVPVTLLVSRISASNLYREDRFIYANSEVQLNTYEYERWSEPPADLLQDLVINALRTSGNFRSVSRISSNLHGDYIVRGQLFALDEVDTGSSIAGRFSFQLELYDPKAHATVWSGAYTHDEPVNGGKKPKVSDVVEALDRNVKAGLSQLTGELTQYLTSHPPQTSSGQ
jgi:ABC-type uncharacterized transport system auxiliary subunit